MAKHCLWIFLISMVPLIELRGAIPVSQAFSPPVPLALSCAVCVAGNIFPVPFIYLFARRFLEWGARKKAIARPCEFFLVKGRRAGEKLSAKAGMGLFAALALFVGVPLPGTGAWTGTLAASILDMGLKRTTAAVVFGALMAGVIMALLSAGAFSFVR